MVDVKRALAMTRLLTLTGAEANKWNETRYSLLEPVRQYAREKLEASGEIGEIQRRQAI